MILVYLWRYPPYIILLIRIDIVSVSYPPVSLRYCLLVDSKIQLT